MAIDKRINYEMQGGSKPARNYLGKQKTVKNVPIKWKSGPHSQPTELAYITKAEKDLILKKDLHGSLKKGANTGPDGIMSLDSQGDYTRDRSPKGKQDAGGNTRSRIAQDKHQQHMREILTGQKNIGQTSAVSDRVREGAVPEIAYGPDGQPKYIGSGRKWVGKSLFNRSGYRDIQNKRGGFFGFGGKKDIQFNPVTKRYEFEEEETGDVKPGMGGRFFGGLMSLLTGIPVVGGAIGTAYDYGKGIFGKNPKDMSDFNRLGLYNERNEPGLEDFENKKIPVQGDTAWKDGTFTWGGNNNINNVNKPYSNVDLGPARIEAGSFINDLNNQNNMASGMQLSDGQFNFLNNNNNVVSNKGIPATNSFSEWDVNDEALYP